MWSDSVIIFEDEDAEALIAEFVRLSALYPNKAAWDITRHIFKFLKDSEARHMQAAMVWQNDLAIMERVRIARLNGGVEPSNIDDTETQLRKLQAIYDDSDEAMKERLAAMRLHAEISGRIIKAVEKKIEDKRSAALPTFVFAQYPDVA